MYKDNHFILQDENTQEVVELSGGQNLGAQVGNRVEVTGTASSARPAVSIATLVLNIAAVTTKSSGGCLSVAANLNAQTEANTAAANTAKPAAEASKGGGSGGMSTGAKIAIVVAVAGGGAGAAIALAGKKSSTSP
jgi:hypothetical protein